MKIMMTLVFNIRIDPFEISLYQIDDHLTKDVQYLFYHICNDFPTPVAALYNVFVHVCAPFRPTDRYLCLQEMIINI
jgi:hypothetical protein